MSDYEYEEGSDDDGEYRYSDGEDDYGDQNTDNEDAQTVGVDANENDDTDSRACGLSGGKKVHKLTDLKFTGHSYSTEVQKCLQRGLIGEGKAVIVDYWDFLPRINSLVVEICSMLSVNYDISLQLLMYHKFDKEKLLDLYYNCDATNKLAPLGLAPSDGACDYMPLDGPDCSSYAAAPEFTNTSATCLICYDDFTISKNEDSASPCDVTGGFCCCCKHMLCTDCYVQYVCSKLHSDGINCIGGSTRGTTVPLFTCPGFKCPVLLTYSTVYKLLYNNESPVTMVTSNSFADDTASDENASSSSNGSSASGSGSASKAVKKGGKTTLPSPPSKPSTVTRPASYYFDKYIEFIVKFYITSTKTKVSLAAPSISIGSHGTTPAPRCIESVQYCPCSTCTKIAVIGKIPTGVAAQAVVSGFNPPSSVNSNVVSNPIVPLLYATNVRCSSCVSSYCLICQQGGHTDVTVPGKPGETPKTVARKQLHVPASCAQYAMWLEKITSGESDTANWLLVNTKRCPGPKCKEGNTTRIEKNQGCNHMTCKVCKYDFCWICMGPWSEHGGSYYKCNKYVEPSDTESKDGMLTKEDEERLAKRELDRYLHYYQRYQGHDVGVKYAASTQTAIVEKKMVELQESQSKASHANYTNATTPLKLTTNIDLNFDLDDGSFMKSAVEQVIASRTVLKYSYVLGFYLCNDISNYNKIQDQCSISLKTLESAKQLFEYQQEMLEKNTELLSELTEEYCNNLYKYTEEFMYSGSGSKPSSASNSASKSSDAKSSSSETPTGESIVDKRDHIINLTRITEKFMSHLLASIGTDGNVSQLLVTEGGNGELPVSHSVLRTESENEYYDFMMQQALMESTLGSNNSSGANLEAMDVDAELNSSSSSSSSSSITAASAKAPGVSTRAEAKRASSGGILNAFWNTVNPGGESADSSNSNSSRAKRSISGNKK